MKRKLAPWEAERKKIRILEQKLDKMRKRELRIEAARYGRHIGKKRKKDASLRDKATFSCPKCKNNFCADLIRLRQDLFECRKCGHTFIKENVIDEFDYDGMGLYE